MQNTNINFNSFKPYYKQFRVENKKKIPLLKNMWKDVSFFEKQSKQSINIISIVQVQEVCILIMLKQLYNRGNYQQGVFKVWIYLPSKKQPYYQQVSGQLILQHLKWYINEVFKIQSCKIRDKKTPQVNITIGSKTYFKDQLKGKKYSDVALDAGLQKDQTQQDTNIITISINTNQQICQIIVDKQTTISCDFNKVSDSIITIKPNVKVGSKKLSIKQYLDNDKCDQILNKISQIEPSGRTLMLIYNSIINRNISNDEKECHKNIKKRMINEINQKQNDRQAILYTIMLCLQSQLKCISKQAEIIFCQKASLQSKITMRLLSLGYAFNKKKCRQTIVEIKQNQSIIKDIKKMFQSPGQTNFSKFQWHYKERISKKYGLRTQNIHILSVFRNPLTVDFQILKPLRQAQGLKQQPGYISDKKKIMPLPYFQKFFLSKMDFDSKGYIQFFKQKNYVQFRGNWPYYQSINGKRFGLNVADKFDNGDNKWLQMKNAEGQWVSVYRGIQNPQDIQSNYFTSQNTAINPGKVYKHAQKTSVNFNEVIGNGIYCTPYMKEALEYTSSILIPEINPSQKYCLIFQCRINPKTIHIAPKQQYWVIRKESDMRPYGIILMKQSVKQKYPRPEQQFKEKFSYKKYKQRIDKTQRS